MPVIKVRDNEPFEVAMKRFKKQCEKAGILAELQAPRVLRQAERAQEEEGGGGAQARAQEDAPNGTVSCGSCGSASPTRSSSRSAIAWTSWSLASGASFRSRRAGRSCKGLCPFHGEKTPSFHVNPDRGHLLHCFGCQEGGDAFAFLMKVENLTLRRGGAQPRARLRGIEIPETRRRARAGVSEAPLRDANEIAQAAYRAALAEPGNPAAAYLTRAASAPTTPSASRSALRPTAGTPSARALRGAACPRRLGEKAGLPRARARPGHYDRLRGRLTFPISRRARPHHRLSAVARSATDREPKYLNTPESPIFHTARGVLRPVRRRSRRSGAPTARSSSRGYFDPDRAARAGVDEALATCGTALAPRARAQPAPAHAQRGAAVRRRRGGPARDGALARGAAARGPAVRAALLPAGDDPDDLLRTRGRRGAARGARSARPTRSTSRSSARCARHLRDAGARRPTRSPRSRRCSRGSRPASSARASRSDSRSRSAPRAASRRGARRARASCGEDARDGSADTRCARAGPQDRNDPAARAQPGRSSRSARNAFPARRCAELVPPKVAARADRGAARGGRRRPLGASQSCAGRLGADEARLLRNSVFAMTADRRDRRRAHDRRHDSLAAKGTPELAPARRSPRRAARSGRGRAGHSRGKRTSQRNNGSRLLTTHSRERSAPNPPISQERSPHVHQRPDPRVETMRDLPAIQKLVADGLQRGYLTPKRWPRAAERARRRPPSKRCARSSARPASAWSAAGGRRRAARRRRRRSTTRPPTIPCASTCARWARSRCSRARARSRSRCASRPASTRSSAPCSARRSACARSLAVAEDLRKSKVELKSVVDGLDDDRAESTARGAPPATSSRRSRRSSARGRGREEARLDQQLAHERRHAPAPARGDRRALRPDRRAAARDALMRVTQIFEAQMRLDGRAHRAAQAGARARKLDAAARRRSGALPRARACCRRAAADAREGGARPPRAAIRSTSTALIASSTRSSAASAKLEGDLRMTRDELRETLDTLHVARRAHASRRRASWSRRTCASSSRSPRSTRTAACSSST